MCLTCSVLLSPLHQQEYCVKPLKLHPLKPQTQFCPYWFWQPSWEMQTKKKIFVHLATFCQILLSSTEKRVFFFFFQSQQTMACATKFYAHDELLGSGMQPSTQAERCSRRGSWFWQTEGSVLYVQMPAFLQNQLLGTLHLLHHKKK